MKTKAMIIILIIFGIYLHNVGAVTKYTNNENYFKQAYMTDLSKIQLIKVGNGVVTKEYYNGELVLNKKAYCDGNGAYFNLPVEFDRSRATIVLEADIMNYDTYSSCNEVSVIIADDTGKGYAVGYASFNAQEMWISFRPDMSEADYHIATTSTPDLGNKWIHTKLIIYPSGHLKGIITDLSTGKSWTVIAKDKNIQKFNRIIILDGNDYKVKNIKVYYDYSETIQYKIVEPVHYIQIPNNTDFGSAYNSKTGWGDYVSVATLSDGKQAIYKHTKYDPDGGAYVLPFTLDRTKYNIVIEADVVKYNINNYNGIRFGLENSNWNGYTTSIGFNSYSLNRVYMAVGYDVRTSGAPVNIKYSRLSSVSYTAGTWVPIRMILYKDGRIYVEMNYKGNVYSYSIVDTKYTVFDRFVIRGGYPYYLRDIRVYAVTEDPLTSVLEQDVGDFQTISFKPMFRIGQIEIK